MYVRFVLILLLVASVGACGDSPALEATITPLVAPAGRGSAEPHLARADDGAIVLSWLEPQGSGVALRYSRLQGDTFRAAQTVAQGDDWFVNWADFPSVVPIAGDLWAAHWLVSQPGGGYAYDVAVTLSRDAGRTWLDPITPHHDGTATEHGFVSLFPWAEGVGVLWLDGRDLARRDDARASDPELAGTSLRFATLARDGTIAESKVVDGLVCDCCQTDVAIGPQGPIAVYRDRSTDEVRDIYVARAVEGEWTPGQPVAIDDWTVTGCPVNGPAIASAGDRVAVAWFTATDGVPRVRLAFSADGGKSFGSAIDVDAADALGRVAVEILADGDVVVTWLRAAGEVDAEIALRRVLQNGTLGPIQTVARTGGGRPTGFPQMIRDGDSLVLAWTDTTVEPVRVQAARVRGH